MNYKSCIFCVLKCCEFNGNVSFAISYKLPINKPPNFVIIFVHNFVTATETEYFAEKQNVAEVGRILYFDCKIGHV